MPTDTQVPSGRLWTQFAELFSTIASGAVQREAERELPYEQVEQLRSAGFTRLTVPVEFGGYGASLPDFFDTLVHLAEADSNLAQILRAHFAVVELLAARAQHPFAQHWLRQAGQGAIFGNAAHERSSAGVGALTTTAERTSNGWRLTGRKAYSTGSLYADWIAVPAADASGGTVLLIVGAHADGVELVDDWDGFGQRLTGSGSTVFGDVHVPEENEIPADPRGDENHLTAFVQLVLLASLAGIGRAAIRDATEFVQTRTRAYSHGAGGTARADPLVQSRLGYAASKAYAAEAAVAAAAHDVQIARSALQSTTDDVDAIRQAEISVVTAQLAVIPLTLDVTSEIFEVGGASATSTTRLLDRHWRNARTLSSHNPAVYQSRVVGDWLLNGSSPTFSWSTGESAASEEASA